MSEGKGKVAHTLIGSISASNIGMTVVRDLRVDNDRLTIQLETTTADGEPITRRPGLATHQLDKRLQQNF